MVSDTEIAEARKLQRHSRWLHIHIFTAHPAHRGHYGAAPTLLCPRIATYKRDFIAVCLNTAICDQC